MKAIPRIAKDYKSKHGNHRFKFLSSHAQLVLMKAIDRIANEDLTHIIKANTVIIVYNKDFWSNGLLFCCFHYDCFHWHVKIN